MAYRYLVLSLLLGIVSSNTILNILPRGYRLDLTPYPGDGVFKGRVRLDIVAYSEETDVIVLHAATALNVLTREIKVVRIADLDSSEEEDDATEEKKLQIKNVERVTEREELIINLQNKIKRDVTYQIDITFDGSLANHPSKAFWQQTYMEENNQKKWIVGLNLKNGFARQVFPCMDEPRFKTWFELSVTHKTEFQIMSSMPIHDTVNFTKEGAFVTDHFQRSPPMSVGSLALFMHDFQVPPVNYENGLHDFPLPVGIKSGVWGRHDFYLSLSKAHSLLPSVLIALELYMSRPFPLPELNLVALPNFSEDEPIDSWGLMMFKESELMNGDSFWLTYKLAKYASSQWINHLTTPDGNATIFYEALQHFLAISVAKQIEQPSFNSYLNNLQTLYLEYSKPVPIPPYVKKTIDVSKLQLILHMLEHTLGTASFKAGFQTFLVRKEFKMYTDVDLWETLTEQLRLQVKIPIDVPRTNIEGIAHSWMFKDRLPLVTVTRDYEENSATITQEAYLQNINSYSMYYNRCYTVETNKALPDVWWIPVVIVTEDKMNDYENISKIVHWLEPQEKQKIFIKDRNLTTKNFMVFNPGNIGPFIVNYDLQNWYLLSQKASTLPEPIRIQVLHDSLSLAIIGRLNYTVALNMTHLLRKEQEATVWRTFYPLAEQMRKQFIGTELARPFDAYIRTLVQPVFDALGPPNSNESALKSDFRAKTKHTLCASGHETCIKEARTVFEQWTKNAAPDFGMPIASSYLCTVFAWGTMEEWNFALDRFINFPSENRTQGEKVFLLRTLSGCPQNATKLEKLLNMTLINETSSKHFTEEDKFLVLQAMGIQNPGAHSILFLFLEKNWSTLKANMSQNLWEYYLRIAFGQGTNEATYKQIEALYQNKAHDLNVVEKEICQNSMKYSETRLKWNQNNVAAMYNWLNSTLNNPTLKPMQSFQFRDIIKKT
uniref:Aminopeptidase N n=1 Tax=Cacopsylla melanoneura TaxID=428564 RepID=A0A8D9EEU3_9HEMI